MKIRNTIAVMICIMLLASCCIVAAAASGSENVGGGFWAWETIPGFMAKSSYLHRLQRHSASAQVGAGEIVRDVVDANKTAIEKMNVIGITAESLILPIALLLDIAVTYGLCRRYSTANLYSIMKGAE